jgi:hypothetical protein
VTINRVQQLPGVIGIAPISSYRSIYIEYPASWAFTSYPPVYTMEVYSQPVWANVPYSNITSWSEWSQPTWWGCGVLTNGTIWCPNYLNVEGQPTKSALYWSGGSTRYQHVCISYNYNQGNTLYLVRPLHLHVPVPVHRPFSLIN